jgi:hypothetical protein
MVGTNRGLKVKICRSAKEANTFLNDATASPDSAEAAMRHAG